ncbi:MAG: zinc-ribbon domain-containing protein [Myxococcales bacterium]
MIVQCAACQARFKIADDKVTDRGVKVRCRKCATVFVVNKEAAPAPDAPPLGRAETSPRPAPLPAAPPPAAPFPVSAARPQPLTPQAPRPQPSAAPKPGQPDAFRRFQTKELGADPFKQPQKLARPDPFAGLEEPRPSASAPAPAANDPFASLDLGGSPIRTPPDGEQTIRRDISPALQQMSVPQREPSDPFLSATIRKTLPPQAVAAAKAAAASQDPFAKLDFGGTAGAPPAAASAADPFANIDLGGPTAPAAAAQAAPSADPFANIDIGAPGPPNPGFGNIDFGAPSVALAQPAPAFPQQPSFAPPAGGTDPFAGIDVGLPSPVAPPAPMMPPVSALPPSPAMPPPPAMGLAAPSMPGLPGSLDLGSIDLSPSEPGFSEEPPEPLPPQGPPPPQPAVDLTEPRTVVKNVKWDGDKVEVKSPAAAYAAQLLSKKAAERPHRSLIASLLMAMVFLAVGGLVAERTARAIKEQGATPTTPAGMLAVTDLTSTFYQTREGRPVFLVRGKVTNRTDQRQAPAVKVTVELRRGDSAERSADAYAGKLADVEEIFQTSGPLEVAEVVQRVASQAGPLEPRATAEFLAVFAEYPDELPDLTIRAVALASPVPPPPAAKAATEPRRPREPDARPDMGAARPGGKAPAKADAKGLEFPMNDPKRPGKQAQPEPKIETPKLMVDDGKSAEPAKASNPAKPAEAPKKYEFPMDDPPKRLKVNSGAPPAKAEPAQK